MAARTSRGGSRETGSDAANAGGRKLIESCEHPDQQRANDLPARPTRFGLAPLVVAIALLDPGARRADAASLAASIAPPPSVLRPRSGDDLVAAFEREDLAESERLLRERAAAGDDPAAVVGLGYVLARRGAMKEALAQFERATGMLRALPESKPRNLALAETLLEFGDAERDAGRPRDAGRHLEEALRLRQGSGGAEDPDVLFYVADLAGAQWDVGRYDEARDGYSRSVPLAERLFGPKSLQVADVLRNLGIAERSSGRFAEAEATLQRALAIQKAAPAPPPVLAATLSVLGMALLEVGRVDEAMTNTARALAIRETALGPRDLDTANSVHNLGLVREVRGDHRGAEEAFRRGLAIREAALGPDDPGVAQSLQGVGIALVSQRRYPEARQALGRALAIQEKSLGHEHPDLTKTLLGLGECECQARPGGGAAFLRRAVSVREHTLGATHPLTAEALVMMGECLRAEDLAGAHAALERGFSLMGKAYGLADVRTLEALALLGATAIELRRLDEAQQVLEQGIAVARAGTARKDRALAMILANAGTLHLVKDDPSRAVGYFEKAVELYERRAEKGDPELAQMIAAVGMSYGYTQKWKPAADALTRAIALYDAGNVPPTDAHEASLLNMLGHAQAQLGQTAAAIRTLERLLPIGRRLYGNGHPAVQQTEAQIASLRAGNRP